jgi:hypothetical protein
MRRRAWDGCPHLPRAASVDWRPDRVYFLTLLEPLAGTTGLWPLPPGRPVSDTVGELNTTADWFTAHGRVQRTGQVPGRRIRDVSAEALCERLHKPLPRKRSPAPARHIPDRSGPGSHSGSVSAETLDVPLVTPYARRCWMRGRPPEAAAGFGSQRIKEVVREQR